MATRVLTAVLLIAAVVVGVGRGAEAQASQMGTWSSVMNWSVIPIHTGVLSDGRVITFGSAPNGNSVGSEVDVWDPVANTNTTVANTLGSDIFCSFGISDPNGGGTLIVGGEIVGANRPTFTSQFTGSALVDFDRMNESRWYPTATTLWDGRTLVQGGVPDDVTNRPAIRVAEIHTPGVGWETLEGTRNPSPALWTSSDNGWWYPKSFVTPAGRVWNMAQDRMFWIDPDANNGDGSLTQIGDFPTDNAGGTSVSVMFDEGRVLQFGGGQPTNTYQPADGSKKTSIIDLNQDPPVITQVADMNLSRHWANGIVLPDGTVLAIGGSRENNREDLGGVAFAPEIYDPVANTWTLMEANATPRLYHSSAALLADGSIFIGGGGAAGSQIPNYPSAEVFFPPYLYDSNNALAPRPQITAAPAEIGYGHTFDVSVSGDVDRVTLLKVNNSTHSMNTQNFSELSFQRSGNTLTVTAPTLATVATPGEYQLFALDSDGVPSVAAMVQVSHTYVPPPPVAEVNVLTNGGFEQNDVAEGTAGDVEAPGWATTRNDNTVTLWDDNNGVVAPEGSQLAELDATDTVTISQLVPVFPSVRYRWMIAHRGRDDDDTIEVLLDGVVVAAHTAGAGPFQDHSGEFTATSSPVTLGIRPQLGGTNGNLIDDVRLIPLCDGLPVTVDIGAGDMPTTGDDVILGTNGDDVIDAMAGNDVVCALGGDDTVVGGDGNDRIFGGSGADALSGNAGDDTVDGEGGGDRVFGGSGLDDLTGGFGSDTVGGGSEVDTVRGDQGNDTISGGSGDDVEVSGGSGDDRVNGGSDDDSLVKGDEGDDFVSGNGGADDVYGGDDDDTVRGGSGNDTVFGNRGDDFVSGNDGTDTCDGGTAGESAGDVAATNCETVLNVP